MICGPLARNTNLVIKRYKKLKNIKIINNYDDFLKSLINTNLFVGSCGVISFELARICVPSILLIMNKNQEINRNKFEDIGHHLILKKKGFKKL